MAKEKAKLFSISSLKKVGILLFLGGFLTGNSLASGAGAVIWGGLTVYDVIAQKK